MGFIGVPLLTKDRHERVGQALGSFPIVVADKPAHDFAKADGALRQTGRVRESPSLLGADRKVFSPKGEAYATQQGVNYVVLPKPGAKSPARIAHERQPWFRSGRNWRSGHEAHIGLLKRRFGLRRCLYYGEHGVQRWVGWGVVTYALWTIARKVAA